MSDWYMLYAICYMLYAICYMLCVSVYLAADSPGLTGFYPNGSLIGNWTLPGISGAQPIAQDQNRNLWIGDALSGTVVMFNMSTMNVSTRLTLTVSNKANILAFNKVNNGLYTAYGTGNVVQLNTATGAALSTTTLVVNPSLPSPSSITPQGLVIDYTNTVYVSDTSHSTVYTVTSTTANNTAEAGPLFSPFSLPKRLTLTPFFTSGLTTPGPLAVDRANNLYICDSPSASSSRVLMVSKQAVLLNTLVFAPIGLSSPQAIAIDASNNVYVIGNTPSLLLLYNPTTQSTISMTAATIYGMAFNPLTGNIMLNTKASSTAVSTFTSVNSNLVLQAQTSSINVSATQFVMDGVGNYYVTNPSTNSILVYSYTGSYIISLTTTYATIGSIAVGVDAAGNIWTLGGNVMTSPKPDSEIIYMQGLGYNGLTYNGKG
jgi:hypothetical protein